MSTRDGEVTSKVEATMARVRSAGSAAGRSTPGTPPGFGADGAHSFPEDLYRSLHQARTIGGGIGVDYALGWRTPIVGQAWMLVRQRIHQEIRIYIDALTAQQSNLNTHLIRALTQVVTTLDGLGVSTLKRQQDEHTESLAALQAEVQTLRARVEELQARLDAESAPRRDGNPAARN